MKTASFSTLLHAFFHEWLVQQRNVSHHTILSYRDTWRLFLRFVSQRQTRPVATLSLPELGASEVLAFLNHIESKVSKHSKRLRLSHRRRANQANIWSK
jgi:site-specific recombinase XerD